MVLSPLVVLAWAFCFCFFYSISRADTSSTTTHDLTTGTLASPVGGCPTGTTPATINSSSQVRWGECIDIFAISFAINQALTQAGISVDKAHYSWRYIHCFNTPGKFCNTDISDRVNTTTGEITDDTYWDELTVVVTITDDEGNIQQTKTWTMDKWYNYAADNPHSTNEVTVGNTRWQVHEDFIELYNHTNKTGTIYTPNDLGSMSFTITGQDKGQWDGFYGPILNTLQTHFSYRTNPCTGNALYDPSCPGYAEAFAKQQYDQNCSANPLYDSGCPGYATALYNQQCTANPLYDAGCPGYADAYYLQQCELDPLYDSGCNGYDQAYYLQQCSLDPLSDTGCEGYAEAYYNQQCTADPLYDIGCNGYAEAYLAQQCNLDPLYDASCTGHYEAQCKADALYDVLCTGYAIAYFNQQCMLNPQYDEQCTGYMAPIDTTDPVAIDDGTGTGDSVVDNVLELPDTPVVELVQVPPSVEIIEPEPEPEPEIIEEVIIEETVQEETIVEEIVVEEIVEEVVVEETTEEEIVEEVVEETIEEEVEEVQEVVEAPKKKVKKKITKKEKAKAKRKKLKAIAQKRAKSLAEKMGDAASFEAQQQVQQQLISMLSFVPDFSKYSKAQLDGGQLQKEVNLKGGRIIDHAFARWFVNDPNYDKLEDLQYNLKGN